MKTLVKAALAVSTGAFLLVGGAGSLAYWQSSSTTDAGSVRAGHLALTHPSAGAWRLNGSPVADIAQVRVVPGDALAWTGSFDIAAVGDNVLGTLAVTGATAGGSLAPYVDVTNVTWLVDGVAHASSVTSADDGKPLTVAINVDFPFGASADNGSQDQVLDLSDVAVSLTQADATPGS
jgi:alternate signal-mediated exported protein